MFLLPSLFLGLAFALVLGGKPSRLAEVRFRASWSVLLAFGLQILLFSRLGDPIPDSVLRPLHLASYGLLVVFALANLRIRALIPVLVGMGLNAAAIVANGGRMPISGAAAEAAGLSELSGSNVDQTATRLHFLGDVFALPYQLPYANIFSVGDLLIGFGMIGFVVVASLQRGEKALSPARILAPLRVAAYRRLAAGKLISHVGDWLTIAALVGWVYQETASTAQVAAVMLVRLAPPVLGGGVAALIVDRLPKHRLLVWIELGRGAAVAGALAAVLLDARPAVLAALACSGVLAAMSNAAVPALVPSLLPAEQLAAANAGLAVAKDGAMALGAVGAGVALSAVGVTTALAVDLATFVAAVLFLRGLPAPGPAAGYQEGRKVNRLRYLLRRRRLLLLVLSFGAATLATGLTNATLPRLLEQEIGMGPGAYGFGLAALAGGLAVGGAVVGFTRVGPTAGRWIGVGLVLTAALLAMLGLADHAPTALLVIGLIGFVDGTTDVLFETSVQREADSRHYGAVFGLASAFMMSTMMGAVALAPLVNRLLDARSVIIGASGFLLAAGVIALIGMRSSSEGAAASPAPEAEEEPALVPAASNGHAKARISRVGEDLSVVAWDTTAGAAEEAARALRDEISVEIVDLGMVSPWDRLAVLASVEKTSRVIVLHDNSGNELLAAEIAATIAEEAFHHLDAPVRRVSAPDQDVVAAVRDLAEF